MATIAIADQCNPSRVTVIGDWGQASFRVVVADEPDERSQGLMFVESMPTMSGMLFVYETPRSANFWMRNTLIPLDMLFANSEGQITSIHENAIPLDETVIPGGSDIQYVLEVNGGLSARLGISVGDQLSHPSIGDANNLACE